MFSNFAAWLILYSLTQAPSLRDDVDRKPNVRLWKQSKERSISKHFAQKWKNYARDLLETMGTKVENLAKSYTFELFKDKT